MALVKAGSMAELDVYMREAKRFSVLTREEEQELAIKWRDDEDINAAHLLVTSNLRFVVKVALEYRNYTDTWGIDAFNGEIAYTHPIEDVGLVVELKYRYYKQTAADFYSDLFPRSNAQNFMARDKELAGFQTQTIGAGISYEFETHWLPGFKRGSVNLFVDYIDFQYDNFRDVTATGYAPGNEPLYGFDSVVTRAFVSLFY